MKNQSVYIEERCRLKQENPEIRILKSESIALEIPESDEEEEPHYRLSASNLKKSISITSIRAKLREKRKKFRQNQCAGILLFLFLGTTFNILAYFTSVWSAQLNAELVKTTVENEHTFRFKLKKKLTEEPSKFLIGLLNFGGRVLSAIGTVMLVQVISAYVKRRRYSVVLKSAAEEADTVLSDFHGGITDTAGECCLTCFQLFS